IPARTTWGQAGSGRKRGARPVELVRQRRERSAKCLALGCSRTSSTGRTSCTMRGSVAGDFRSSWCRDRITHHPSAPTRPRRSALTPSSHTAHLHRLVAGIQHHDPGAADELFRRVTLRLECLARRMLRCYPLVRAQEQTDDVLQGASLRLLETL